MKFIIQGINCIKRFADWTVRSGNLLSVVIFADEIAMDLTWLFKLDSFIIMVENEYNIFLINLAPSQ